MLLHFRRHSRRPTCSLPPIHLTPLHSHKRRGQRRDRSGVIHSSWSDVGCFATAGWAKALKLRGDTDPGCALVSIADFTAAFVKRALRGEDIPRDMFDLVPRNASTSSIGSGGGGSNQGKNSNTIAAPPDGASVRIGHEREQ
jgi:hypothetical protein